MGLTEKRNGQFRGRVAGILFCISVTLASIEYNKTITNNNHKGVIYDLDK